MTEATAEATATISDQIETDTQNPELTGPEARRFLRVTFFLLVYQGFTMAITGIGAPFIAKSFGLTQSGIAALYAWISLSAIGGLLLSRFADRVGRRRVLLICMAGTSVSAMVGALSPTPAIFTIAEILVFTFASATVAISVVMLAEELPVSQRARGQSVGGLGVMIGGGLCLLLMPQVAATAWSWRWALVVSSAGVLLVPLAARAIPESARWKRVQSRGTAEARSFYDIFGVEYRSRAIPVLIAWFLNAIANTAVQSWLYFHIVTVVKLSPGVASAVLFIGGGVSAAGFILGAWSCERFGRVPTVVAFGVLLAFGSVAFYWGPPSFFPHAAVWLCLCFAWLMVANNCVQVGGNSAASELFPTALRGTVMGFLTLVFALGATTSHVLVAGLAPLMGGLSNVVGYLAMLVVPAVVIFGLFIDETRGLTLEAAAHEKPIAGERAA